MIIDSEERFDTENDELVWTKIIRINPFGRDNTESTHVVKYYKTEDKEEYYLFEYIMADNNGNIVNNFNGHYWNEIVKQIDISDYCYVYAQDSLDKNYYWLITRGKSIKRRIEEDIN